MFKIATFCFVLAALLLPGFMPAATVVLPYTNDFSSSAADFTASGNWSLGSGAYTNVISSGGVSSSASVSASEATAATGFVMSTTFTLNSFPSANATIGFAALGVGENFAAANNYYLADVTIGGNLRLFEIDTSSTQLRSDLAWGGGELVVDTIYTLTFTGTPTMSGGLTLLLTLTDGADTGSTTVTLSAAQVAAGPNGTNFGLRNRVNTSGSEPLSVGYDSFGLSAVPEPSHALLAAFGLGTLLLRRRR